MITIETLVVQITNRCPYHCPQCYMHKGNADMPIGVAFRYIDELLYHGLESVQITGGEPLVYSQLRELIEHAHNKGLYVFLATSGYDHSIALYQALLNSGLDVLCISINDIDESSNQLTRDTYEESIMAIQDALEVGLTCFANVVVSNQNIKNLGLLAQYLKRLGVESVDVLRSVNSFDGKYVPSVSQQTIQQLDGIVKNDPEFFRVENCFKEYWEYITQERFVCQDVGNKAIFVNVDGTVSPCSKLQQFRYNSIDEMMKDKIHWKGGCCR